MGDEQEELSVWGFILAVRGGQPENCDFCGRPFTEERCAIPEEAGEWACSECVDSWNNYHPPTPT